MKFAHFADCHIGSWRDQKLRDLSVKAFAKAVDECIKERVDFIIIAGDFFNTALPPLDNLKEVVKKLKELKDKNIPIYGVTGSHDYSASGKTMIDVIEHAGLFRNVFRGSVNEGKLKLNFTIDEKTSAKITGIKGRKGLLDKKYYEALEKGNLESEKGFKIFIFHTAIEELKPKELDRMDSAPLSYLPKNFDYYAGGHVHYIFYEKIPDYGIVAYPGALFPVNFAEIEKYSLGGYYLVNADKKNNIIKAEWRPIKILNTYSIKVDCNNKNPRQVENEIKEVIKDKEFFNPIVTIRLFEVLERGK
ncbi:MAG: exonuclease SbcCD subunit D, partial [Candidatus Woesearchaeota archaeon]|nr:exonuclease SbcCD subunit D [Candidatus Woesearchaeota archaeon]